MNLEWNGAANGASVANIDLSALKPTSKMLVAFRSWSDPWTTGQGWSVADGGRWEPAGPQHWFGTNVLGQDIFQRAVYSVRTAFEIGLAVVLAQGGRQPIGHGRRLPRQRPGAKVPRGR